MSDNDLKLVVRAMVPVVVEVRLHGITPGTSIAHVLGKVRDQAMEHIDRELHHSNGNVTIQGEPVLEISVPLDTLAKIPKEGSK